MNNEEYRLWRSANENISIMRCPCCLGCNVGIGCKTKTTVIGRNIMFKTSMTCGRCFTTVWNDNWHSSFEEALHDLHNERIRISIENHGIINYGCGGEIIESN